MIPLLSLSGMTHTSDYILKYDDNELNIIYNRYLRGV